MDQCFPSRSASEKQPILSGCHTSVAPFFSRSVGFGRGACPMASWGNPLVAKLAVGEASQDDLCGFVVVCSWPMPEEVLAAYERFRSELTAALPDEAYVYPGTTLHCTVMTLRAFTAGPMDSELRESLRWLWEPVLASARAMEAWPVGTFTLRIGRPTLEGSAGIFRYEDVDGAIAQMRDCLRSAIDVAGGRAAEGMDWSQAMPLSGTPEGQPAPQIPNIVHSTTLRWCGEPADRDTAKEAFDRVAETWVPMQIKVSRATAVFEDTPYMHISADDSHIWWDSEKSKY
mmetsp:Transcript_78179/g.252771  ORF Transcript_78179/g.252771 Transcript_78179/m.252771 type:complete len:287 (+) Transcript_78179:2977-3837(+)